MAEPKTKPIKGGLAPYLNAIDDPQRKRDTRAIIALMRRATGASPILWGTSIIGFGVKEYPAGKGKTAAWPLLAFAPRSKGFVLYLGLGSGAHRDLLQELGKIKVSGGCLHIRQLADVDLPVLNRLLAQSAERMRAKVTIALLGVIILALGSRATLAQGTQPPDQPAVTVRGQTYTPRSILARNMGSDEDQTTAFPPHKVIGNIYYVGTRTLTSFLITTPAGHILLNSTYERNVRTIQKSVTQLGFTFEDIRIVLGTHAHGDHQEGDALVKQLTGAQVMAMREDVPALEGITPGGKAHPLDRTLRDGEQVTLGGSTLVAHLTPGHTRGCTTWTMKAQEGGRTFDVVFACSYRAPANVTPEIENEFNRTFTIVRAMPCDVPLGDHAAQYNLAAKYARLAAGAPNPFIDPGNCWNEAEIQEAMLRAQLQMQQKATVIR